MAQTPSNMLPLGTTAPDFKLLDTVSDTMLALQEVKGLKATVIMFICNHCPFVKHVNKQLAQLAKDYKSKGVNFVAISSNDVENYPEDHPKLMHENARKHNDGNCGFHCMSCNIGQGEHEFIITCEILEIVSAHMACGYATAR